MSTSDLKESKPSASNKKKRSDLPWGMLGVLAVVVVILAVVVHSRPPSAYNKPAAKVQTQTQAKSQQKVEETVATSAAGNISKLGSRFTLTCILALIVAPFSSTFMQYRKEPMRRENHVKQTKG